MLELILIVSIFSFLQSVFGVGLLLFGTPTLLLMDFQYTEVLWILLPCSLIISLIQTVTHLGVVQAKKKVAYLTLPAMSVSLFLIVTFSHNINITKIVGVFLLITGLVKFSPRMQQLLNLFIEKKIKLYYIFIGLVHGLSNMGGGPLSILMTSIYSEKIKIRANTAFIYLILASFQLIVLVFVSHNGVNQIRPHLLIVVLVTYLVANHFFSNKINDKKYVSAINILILIYGIFALIK
jgi:uncharacterized protein